MEREQARGIQAAVFAFVMWGSLTVYWKQLSHLDPFEMIGWRIVSATVVMLFVVSLMGRWPAVLAALNTRAVGGRIVLAALLLTVNWTTYVWAVVNDRVIETALGYFLAPLGTMVMGVTLLGERLTLLKSVSMVFTATAVVILTISYGRMPWVALLIAGSWSFYALAKRRVPLEPVESLAGELLVLVIPAAVLVTVGWFRADGIPQAASTADWFLLGGTGVITAIPLLLFAFAAQRVPFTILGPANYAVPIINLLLGAFVYDEALPATRIVGFGLVWVALVLVAIDTVAKRNTAPDPVAVPIR